MQLKLIKYHPLFAYSVGDVFEVNEKDTKHLLDGKYAVPASDDDQLEKLIAKEEEDRADKDAQAALNDASIKSKPGKNKNKN